MNIEVKKINDMDSVMICKETETYRGAYVRVCTTPGFVEIYGNGDGNYYIGAGTAALSPNELRQIADEAEDLIAQRRQTEFDSGVNDVMITVNVYGDGDVEIESNGDYLFIAPDQVETFIQALRKAVA